MSRLAASILLAVALVALAATVAPSFVVPRIPKGELAPQLSAAKSFLGASDASLFQEGAGSWSRLAGLGLLAVGVAALATSRRIGSTSAPTRACERSVVVARAFENELGVQPPVGFWDPAGFTSDGDEKEFFRRRCVEIKHGRVSMIACIGFIVPEYFKWPGYLSPSSSIKFTDVPNGLAALTKVPALGWQQIVFFCLAMELFGAYQDPKVPPGKLGSRLVVALTEIKDWPNNYTFGPFGIINGAPIADPEVRKKKLNAEIANGRLAMVAIMAMFFQNGTVGTTGPEMWLPAGAMPKAMEGTGGPNPNDVWDPAGLSKGKTEEQLLYWRAVELKHGRVSMLAILGWFHTAGGWHPIGDFAARQRVSDDPLIAVTQLPMAGAWQLIFTLMCLEWLTTYVCKPPPQRPWDVLGWQYVIADGFHEDPEWKETQLRELNNGRLAMMGIIGLIAQDLYTGDFAGAIIQEPCFGNVVCKDVGQWNGVNAFPTTPFVMPPLYPEGPPIY